MLTQVTINKLHDMHLSSMADVFADQCHSHDYDNLSFEDRFGMLVDREWDKRRSNKFPLSMSLHGRHRISSRSET